MEKIYGKNAVRSFLEQGQVKEVVLLDTFSDESIVKLINKHKVKVTIQNKKYFDSIATKNQGIIGIIDDYKYYTLDEIIANCTEKYNTILMLDGVEDPHNFGAIIRSCEAFKVAGIIIPKHNNVPLNSTVIKVSTGAISNVKICEVTNLTMTLKELKDKGFWVYEAEARQGNDFNTLDYKTNIVLVVGSEGFGISSLVRKQADFNIYIPMMGKVNSLNVSVASAVLLSRITYEQRKKD